MFSYANYQVVFVTTRSSLASPLASLLFEVLATKCTADKWFILSIMNNYHYLGRDGKMGFLETKTKDSKCPLFE